VAAFSTAEHGELLWTSARALYAAGKAIRGGVPICFPWFGGHPTRPDLPAHGFARTTSFTFEGSEERGDSVVAELSLVSTPETQRLYPHELRARMHVSVGRELKLSFEVENTGDTPLSYEIALHTYLGVSDVRQVEVEGLAGSSYNDKVSGQHGVVQGDAPLRFVGETDRVYSSTARVVVTDPVRKRRLIVDKTASGTTVVWNPWRDKAQRMSDFGDDEWLGMLCIEAANAGTHRIQLPATARHTTTTLISAETT
jgi:glucose-6-phosphate 1-epimerase